MYNVNMGKSINVKRKRRGRPATGTAPLVGVRLVPALTGRIDAWAETNGVSRSEAIRRLIEQALASQSKAKKHGPG
jgi:Ribbon-helix-helix protein, copG family